MINVRFALWNWELFTENLLLLVISFFEYENNIVLFEVSLNSNFHIWTQNWAHLKVNNLVKSALQTRNFNVFFSHNSHITQHSARNSLRT